MRILILLLISFPAIAEYNFTKPNIVLQDKNKNPVEGETLSTEMLYCVHKAQKQPTGTYYCVQPDVEIVVSNQSEPAPPPATPPPTTPPSASCTATGNKDNYYSVMADLNPGDILCLEDGIYTNGLIVPSGIRVVSIDIGKAEFIGGDPSSWSAILIMDGSNSAVDGIKIHHPTNYTSDACSISGSNNIMRNTSCSNGGTHEHKIPLKITGTGHLIENSWFYGEGRYVVQCFEGDNITIRQNVARWDKTKPNEPKEPNAAMSNYSCSNMIWENNISLDYGKPETEMIHCGDICMSTTTSIPNERVQYLGNMVFNHHTDTLNNTAFRADQKVSTSNTISIKDMWVKKVGTGFKINPNYSNVTIENCTMIEISQSGLSSGSVVECANNADITNKYIDGVKTNQPLWPWPNEEKIRADMCATDERQSDWCLTNMSLSEYLQ